ncbi:MAG: hypothetical protein K5697_01505 [Lachnospiraceae bacterium]|nr:hypothetical protein [Lachnospiraceae bacterium]
MWKIIGCVAGGIALLVLLLILRAKHKKKKKKAEELERVANDVLRGQELDRRILNEKAGNEKLKRRSEGPYDVKYSTTAVEKDNIRLPSGKRLLLHIEEKGLFTNREYMLDPAGIIYIGSGRENDISLIGGNLDEKQCEIGIYDAMKGIIYIRNIGSPGKVKLVRKKRIAEVGNAWIELKNKDVIITGEVQLKITFVKAGGK